MTITYITELPVYQLNWQIADENFYFPHIKIHDSVISIATSFERKLLGFYDQQISLQELIRKLRLSVRSTIVNFAQ